MILVSDPDPDLGKLVWTWFSNSPLEKLGRSEKNTELQIFKKRAIFFQFALFAISQPLRSSVVYDLGIY